MLLGENVFRIQTFLDNLPASVCLIRAEEAGHFRFVTVNQSFADLLGRTRDEISGHPPQDIFPTAVAQRFIQHFQQCVETDEEVVFESRLDDSPTTTWYYMRLQPLKNQRGQVVRLIGTAMNITLHKQTQLALRREREKSSHYFNVAGSIIVALNKDQSIELINEAGSQMLGLPAEEINGKNFFEHFVPEGDRARMQSLFQEYVVGHVDGPVSVESRVTSHTGKTYHVVWHSRRLYDENEQLVGVLSAGLDITERRRAQQAEEKARRLQHELQKEQEIQAVRTNFLSMMAHDLKGPLTGIHLAASLLQDYDDKLDAKTRARKLTSILTQVNELTELLDDVLTFNQNEAENFRFEPARHDLIALCQKTATQTQEEAQQSRITLEVPDEPLWVELDRRLIQRVISNLLSNALKYSDEGSPVSFRCYRDGDQAVLEVTDEGIGIPPQDQAKLFEPFRRGKNAGHRTGSGLGLAIVKQVVEKHSGCVNLTSRLGEGTTITVTLPLEQGQQPAKQQED